MEMRKYTRTKKKHRVCGDIQSRLTSLKINSQDLILKDVTQKLNLPLEATLQGPPALGPEEGSRGLGLIMKRVGRKIARYISQGYY
jgi:hypothetical protein